MQRIEDCIMQKEMYNYQRIQEAMLLEKKAAREAFAESEKLPESNEKGRTGDPFKDFDLDLAKVTTPDARF